jgi:hypothetical protein
VRAEYRWSVRVDFDVGAMGLTLVGAIVADDWCGSTDTNHGCTDQRKLDSTYSAARRQPTAQF